MHIEFLVEEVSAEAALTTWRRRSSAPTSPSWCIPTMESRISSPNYRDDCAAYRSWLPADWRIAVVLDADEGDCLQLKARHGRGRVCGWTGHTIGGGRRAIPGAQPVGGTGVGGVVLRRYRGLVRRLSGSAPTWASARNIAARTQSPAGRGRLWNVKLQRAGYAAGGLVKVPPPAPSRRTCVRS